MTAFGTAIGGKADLEPPSMIRNAFGCAVIVVHHCGIDATRPRGHTSLAAPSMLIKD
jgi:hypothetical protein